MSLRWAMLFALAACGGTAPAREPVKPVAVAMKAEVIVPPCITQPDEGAAVIARATADGTRVAFCIAKDTQCFALDVEAGKLEKLKEPPPPAPASEARVETVDPKLEVCTGESCKQLTPKVLPTATHLRAATNTDGTYAVFLLGDAAKAKGYAEVWDVANSKRTATFRYGGGEFRCGEVAMLGAKTIYISATQCGQPAARAALYRLNGSKIANVGGKDFGSYGSRFVQVSGTTWAFLEENASQLVIQDIAKGKVTKTIDVTPLFKSRGAEMSNPGESALVRLGDGRLAVIAGAPATGTLGVIDPTAGSLTIMPAPICQ
jgi:hypothetical protein